MLNARWIRAGEIALCAIAAALLLSTAIWLVMEHVWISNDAAATYGDAFEYGTLGLEIAPLKMLLALDRIKLDDKTRASDVFQFHPGSKESWTKSYGFLARPISAGVKLCEADDNVANANLLPIGFTVSNRLPQSATPTSMKFAGLSCALCHSETLHTISGKSQTVIGGGSISLNLISWVDGFENLVMDPRLTPKAIFDGYDSECGRPSDISGSVSRVIEYQLMGAWLAQIRAQMKANTTQYDLPFSGPSLIDPHLLPAGPSRTRPFRSIVRTALNLPGGANYAFSKVPGVFLEDPSWRPRSQYDGSIGDPDTRSMVAAYTSGSSLEALAQPAIEQNVRSAARYTLHLGENGEIPTLAQFAGSSPDPLKVQRGYESYMRHCNICHGSRNLVDGKWTLQGAAQHGKIVTVDKIGTDAERINFPDSEILVPAIYGTFPATPANSHTQIKVLSEQLKSAEDRRSGSTALLFSGLITSLEVAQHKYPTGHPFTYAQDELVKTAGFINNPIPYAWLRAPYLHNGSVPTLAEFIGLETRPTQFCRGDNPYDVDAAGIVAPAPGVGAGGSPVCPDAMPFLCDARQRGNSNAGHEYPFPSAGKLTDAQKSELKDLLEYLKTL